MFFCETICKGGLVRSEREHFPGAAIGQMPKLQFSTIPLGMLSLKTTLQGKPTVSTSASLQVEQVQGLTWDNHLQGHQGTSLRTSTLLACPTRTLVSQILGETCCLEGLRQYFPTFGMKWPLSKSMHCLLLEGIPAILGTYHFSEPLPEQVLLRTDF